MKANTGDSAARLDAIETSSRKAATEAEKAVSRLATISTDTQRAFDNVGKELATLRTNVNRVTIESKDLAEKLASPTTRSSSSSRTSTATTAPPPTSGATASTPAASSRPPELSPEGTYTIKSGDTFARLSGRFGVSVQAIEQANPGVDPRRLGIGQAINIPTSP
ncbi:MAG: hypothetical protein DRP71_16400 [Verrucomicrobia bacterium]|nr:MAG: hypothetical protein DRP71_16400 [Verrucomicrobiota bacterium]